MQGRHATPSVTEGPPELALESHAVPETTARSKRDRQRAIRDLVERETIGSQGDLVDRLNALGFAVTQATVSRDVAELGLIKVPRSDGYAYIATEALIPNAAAGSASEAPPVAPRSDDRLRRILADIPVSVGRSGLILVVTGSAGTANVIAQAIDDSSLSEQVGTLAGDNTVLILFADEPRLEAWLDRFDQIRSTAGETRPS
jgi:transcriptional regulator of arginine metabolism